MDPAPSKPHTGKTHPVAPVKGSTVHVSAPITSASFYFQLLPTTSDEKTVASAAYTVKVDGKVVAQGTSGPDGTISLPMLDGSTTTLEVSGTSYALTVNRSSDTSVAAGSGVQWLSGPTGAAWGPGIGLHNLAFNDLSWLRAVNSRPYWMPLVPQSGIELGRSLDQLPRDLTTKFSAYLERLPPGSEGTWNNMYGTPIDVFRPDPSSPATRPFTLDELKSLDGIVRRYNANPESISASELQLMREAVRIHIDGSTPNTPLNSYSVPETKVGWTNQRKYRVRVKVDRGAAVDASKPNAFNEGVESITNVSEAEFSVVGDQSGRIVTVEAVGRKLGPVANWVVDNAEAVRWGGRILIIGGVAYSSYKIANASAEERPKVIGQEVGGQVGGLGGATLATAGCIAFGVATEGAGLFVCGVVGGVGGGVVGSATGGQVPSWYNSAGDAATDAIWKAIHHSAEQQGDIPPPALDGVGDDILGDPVFP